MKNGPPKLNPAAAALGTPQFRQRVVRDKTKYSRKAKGGGKAPAFDVSGDGV